MKCSYCGELDTRVIDSRATQESSAIRRRRLCLNCNNRFTTMEKPEKEPLIVIKRDGRREIFDAGKILRGLLLAGQKRDIPLSQWESLVENLEQELRNSYIKEVATDAIGDIILNELRKIDEVAYVRFASVFRQFSDIEAFKLELEEMLKSKKTTRLRNK